jgi:hypothetical protein
MSDAFATVPVKDFVLTSAEPQRRRSTTFGERWFCAECGAQIAMHVDHQPDTIDFTIASLDTPDVVRPEFQIFFGEKITWFDTHDELPRYSWFRPDTRGP